MDTEVGKPSKLVASWLELFSSPLSNASECVILGLGKGEYLEALVRKFPDVKINIVDPRITSDFRPSPSSFAPITYITSIDAVKLLAHRLQSEHRLIPVLPWKPGWYPETIFFKWAQYILINGNGLDFWKDSESLFILESLFK